MLATAAAPLSCYVLPCTSYHLLLRIAALCDLSHTRCRTCVGCVHGRIFCHAFAHMPPRAQEVEGLRNQYLDSFLPARRKQPRHAREAAAPRERLHFARFPIVDLGTPSHQLCAPCW